ncbi:hypothetical protein ASE64_04815 [Agreia sp. Leaf210]|nr:hypothetical protein ASE64_04815 [Agreia sp. Leaf210]
MKLGIRMMLATLAVAMTVTGCGVVNNAQPTELTFAEAKAGALSLVDEMEQMLPSEAIIASSDNGVRVACGNDAAQFDGIRTVSVGAEFDRAVWLDDAAAEFEKRRGWTVQKNVRADDSSNATSALAVISADGYYLRLDEFATTSAGGPVMVLSASSPCVRV